MRTMLTPSQFKSVLLLFLFLFLTSMNYAGGIETQKNATSVKSKEEKKNTQTDVTNNVDTSNNTAEKKGALKKGETATEKEGFKRDCFQERSYLVISILFFVVMLFLFYKFFDHIKKHDQYIGFQSIKLIGLILMFPGICILALAGNNLISDTTLAALLGTIAGYVLSRDEDSKGKNGLDSLAKLKQEKEALEAKYTEMEQKLNAEITALRNGN
jgi:cell division protein FtsB